jgi:hypothetical protein
VEKVELSLMCLLVVVPVVFCAVIWHVREAMTKMLPKIGVKS